ncbi:MAG: hypothetical protein U1D69_09765 [Polynucleobacter sp.]|nr:hypothetical protein [Polynucleobacter sp.]
MKSDNSILIQLFRSITISLTLALISPYSATAQTSTPTQQAPQQASTTVKQVFTDRGRVVAETAQTDLKVQDELVITLEGGKQCALPILEIRGNILTLDSENCRYNFDIKPGLALEKSLLSAAETAPIAQKTIQAPPQQEPVVKKAEVPIQEIEPEKVANRKTKFVVGLAFSGRTSSSGTGGTASGLIGTFTSEFEYKEGFSVSAEMRDSPSNSWGYGVGITYDSNKELDSGTFSSGGTTLILTSAGGASKIGSTSLEVNAIYRWNEFYVPFGLNYTAIRFTPASGYTGGYDVEGGFGAQLGFGVHVSDAVSLEMISRAAPYSLRISQSGSSVNFGNLMYSIVTFGIKGHF